MEIALGRCNHHCKEDLMSTIDTEGPRTPQEPAKSRDTLKRTKSRENLISLQQISRENIQQKPEHQIDKENLTPNRQSETMKAVAKATYEMAKRVKKQSSFFGTIRGLLKKTG